MVVVSGMIWRQVVKIYNLFEVLHGRGERGLLPEMESFPNLAFEVLQPGVRTFSHLSITGKITESAKRCGLVFAPEKQHFRTFSSRRLKVRNLPPVARRCCFIIREPTQRKCSRFKRRQSCAGVLCCPTRETPKYRKRGARSWC